MDTDKVRYITILILSGDNFFFTTKCDKVRPLPNEASQDRSSIIVNFSITSYTYLCQCLLIFPSLPIHLIYLSTGEGDRDLCSLLL